MVFDFFTQALYMHVYGAGVADVFIAPDVIQQLLPGKYLIGRGSEEIQQLQFLGRHVYRLSVVEDRIVGLVHDKVGVFHSLDVRGGFVRLGRMVAAEYGLDPCHQLFGVKGLDDIVVCAQLQSQYLVENFPFGRKHDNRHI